MILAFITLLGAACSGGDRVPVVRGDSVEIIVDAVDLDVEAHSREEMVLPRSGATCERIGNLYRVDLRAASTKVTIDVPIWMPIKVIATDGRVKVSGARAGVDVTSRQGDVIVTGGRDRIYVSSTGGTVTVEDARGLIDIQVQHRPVLIQRSSGDVHILNVTGITTLKGVEARQLDASTVTGEINCECAPAEGAEWSMRASTGAVNLYLPQSASATVTLDAPPHAADIRFPGATVEQIDSRQQRTTIGRGGARIRMSSFSGAVVLDVVRPTGR